MTSDERVPCARTAAAVAANRQRRTVRLAADVVQRLADLPKTEFAALAFAVVDEIERRDVATPCRRRGRCAVARLTKTAREAIKNWYWGRPPVTIAGYTPMAKLKRVALEAFQVGMRVGARGGLDDDAVYWIGYAAAMRDAFGTGGTGPDDSESDDDLMSLADSLSERTVDQLRTEVEFRAIVEGLGQE